MTIVTPEGLSMDVTLAGIGSRGVAVILDSLIQGVLLLAIILLMALFGDVFEAPGGSTAENVVAAVAIVLIFLDLFAYHAFFEAFSAGQTPGKRAAGIRVVDVGGGPIGFKAAAIRNLMRIIDSLPIFYGVGIISSIASRRNQRLGDMVAGTIVIHAPKRARKKRPVHEHTLAHDPRTYETWDVSAVTQEELATVRMFLERRSSLQAGPRYDLAEQLAARLRSKVHGAHDEDAEVFLEKLAAAKAARG